MLIIFDLDDTLIETTKSITPWKLKNALSFAATNGLNIKNFNEALDSLLRINANADSAVDALLEFLELQDADSQVVDSTLHYFYEDMPDDMPVPLFEGAQEVIHALGEDNHLAIVTAGRRKYQEYKIEKAGIDCSLFCTIQVSESKDKKPYYLSIREMLGIAESNVCVCGDRIEKDLIPAKELGYKTVHIKQGRGEKPSKLTHFVDYQIREIAQLPDIIGQLKEIFETK